MAAQFIFDLNLQPLMTRDSFVQSASNAQALALIELWPNWDGPLAIITGGEASGKSHIAAIWRMETGARAITPVELNKSVQDAVCITAPILIEDIGELSNDEETALFHLINMARSAKQHILLTSQHPVGKWEIALPDLKSRLVAAQKAEIGPPNDALLSQLFAKLFADRQLRVESDVISYLILRMERSTAMLRAMVGALDSAALAQNKRVTKAMAAEVLTEIASKRESDQLNLL